MHWPRHDSSLDCSTEVVHERRNLSPSGERGDLGVFNPFAGIHRVTGWLAAKTELSAVPRISMRQVRERSSVGGAADMRQVNPRGAARSVSFSLLFDMPPAFGPQTSSR